MIEHPTSETSILAQFFFNGDYSAVNSNPTIMQDIKEKMTESGWMWGLFGGYIRNEIE